MSKEEALVNVNLAIVAERLGINHMNSELGRDLRTMVDENKFTPIYWKELSDENFKILSFDLNLSDLSISKIFDVGVRTIETRRNKLEITRGHARLIDWILSERGLVNLDEFVKEISV